MNNIVLLLLVGLLVSLSHQQSGPKAPASFSALLDRKEQIARMVCSNLTNYFDNLAYNLPNLYDRESCFYYDGCDKNLEFKIPKYGCALGFNYGNPERKCSSCSARSVSFEYSVTLFPTGDDGVQKYTPRTAVSIAEIRDLRCALQDLRYTYRDAKYKVDDTISQIYVAGEYAPMINTYPGLNWRFNNSQSSSVCLENDAFTTATSCFSGFEYRNRPWFVSASYVSKNILLIVDYASVVMRGSSGYSRTVSAINSLLKSLNERDKIAAVLFTTKAIIYPGNEKTGFLFANEQTKSSLLDWILSLFVQTSSTTNSGSYHSAAFETSFGFLKQYSSSLINCDTSLVVFGDADNIKDESNPVTNLLSQYQSLSNYLGSTFVKKVRVFSFSVGIQKGQANPLKSYPCLTGGLWIPLDNSDATTEQAADVRGLMSPFFSFHSYRRLGKNDTIWSNFYSDLLGIGNMTTASLPCYSSSGTFLGVVGVDVPASLFNTTTYPDAFSEFTKRQALSDGVGYCPDVQIQDSFIDDLRGGSCNYCNQPCGNLAVMLGFIPAVLVAFVVFVIVAFYFYKRSLMKAEGDDEKEDKALVK